MFKIESYVTPILLSYVDKYVKDFKPADAQVSLWGGGVLLQNLVLKTDVLQQEVPLPFTLVSGRIHELLIQVPWTKIMSEPIIVTIDTIECILNLRPPSNDEPKPETPSEKPQVVEAPPGYMQALVRRVVSNIAIKVHHLIVKYVQDDIVLSLNIKELSVNSAGTDWKPAFADIEAANPAIRRLIVLDDLTLCLDSTDSDGKIRFYQDPLLYRCGLEFRVLAKLVSPNTRRAKSFEIEMLTSKLAWGITTAQLLLLLRLVKEPVPPVNETPSPTSAKSQLPAQLATTLKKPAGTTNTAEPSRHESWSDWAWSWMPSSERIHGKSEAPMASCPVPVSFAAYLDQVSLVIKTLETEANNRKRPRSILELTASYAAIKSSICVPTYLRVKAGIRYLVLQSNGKCTCGHSNSNTISGEPTIYLSGRTAIEKEWKWPDEKAEIELAEIAEEKTKVEPGKEPGQKPGEKPTEKSGTEYAEKSKKGSAEISERESSKTPEKESTEKSTKESAIKSDEELEKKTGNIPEKESESKSSKEPERESGPSTLEQVPINEDPEPVMVRSRLAIKPITVLEFDELEMSRRRQNSLDEIEAKFWNKLSPVLTVEIVHERSPPSAYINPYDKHPKSFEYSDWEEQFDAHVNLKPLDLRVCMGLIHRLILIKSTFAEVPPAPLEPMRVLTVEECEALNTNLPQRRTNIEIIDFRVNVHPWDHSLCEKPTKAPLLLRVELPKANFVIAAPLYAQRVCSAAGQLPEDTGLLWQACRIHTTAALHNIKISVCTPTEEQSKPCGRIDARFVTHTLLYPEYFAKKRSIVLSYAIKIREGNISGSSARLHGALEVIKSVIKGVPSAALRQTTLAKDALDDEDLVALDITAEDLTARGFITNKVKTTILTLQSLRATVFQSAPDKELQQAWLFSGPDNPTSTPYLRLAFQWCVESFPGSVEFFGLWTEPTALAVDPLLISWLTYKPSPKQSPDSLHNLKLYSSIHSIGRQRSHITPPSSSGRGQTRSGTADAEQVHRVQSIDSSSEKSEKKEINPDPPPEPQPGSGGEPGWMGDNLLQLHERLKHVLMNVDLGLILIYFTTQTATAVGCETVRVAMEEYATEGHSVVVYSVGRWSLFTNTVTKHLWYLIDQDGPTYTKEETGMMRESFPWKILLGDMSCYTLKAINLGFGHGVPQADMSRMLRSQLKATAKCQPHTILELVSTNVVLSVVTKTLQHKVIVKKAETEKKKEAKSKEEAKVKYFTSGTDFKPKTFLEFLRGPSSRKRESATQSDPVKDESQDKYKGPTQKLVPGPIVSIGFNLHADTPPLICRIEHDQVQLLVTSLHCLKHVITLLRQNITLGVQSRVASSSNISRSEIDEEESSESDSAEGDAELITILQSREDRNQGMKTFFWFQWVISRVTTVFTADNTKLVMEIDDTSMSLDLQENYDQFKIKIAAASIKHFELINESWVPGTFGGRVLEVVESLYSKEDTHFLAVTITVAQISKLPESWKEELHPKLLEQRNGADKMWEIYAVLASLEVIIVPKSLENIVSLLNTITAPNSCSPPQEVQKSSSTFDLPYCYLNAGGLKLVLACEVEKRKIDDTFLLTLNKITINPHPDNPICRQPVTATDTGYLPGNLEGRQYELSIKGISLETVQLNQLVTKQESESDVKISNENPAVKWSTAVTEPTLSPILHPLDIELLLAPALFISGTLVCGKAVEFNLTSDCALEFNVDQLILIKAARKLIRHACTQHILSNGDLHHGKCPYEKLFKDRSEPPAGLLRYISPRSSRQTLNEDDDRAGTATVAGTVDSGMDTATSRSKSSIKKCFSVGFVERHASDYLEIFLTTGSFEVSLYTVNDGSEQIKALRPTKPIPKAKSEEIIESSVENGRGSQKSVTDTTRLTHPVELDLTKSYRRLPLRTTDVQCVPLLHATFHQPNLYYWKRRSLKNLQVSLFNMWFGLGTVFRDDYWHAEILTTARGIPDPETEIPPALVTMKYTSGALGGGSFISTTALNQRGTLNLDIERPVHIEASRDNVRRLIDINNLIKSKCAGHEVVVDDTPQDPIPYKLRRLFINYSMEVATIQTSQIGLTVDDTTLGFDSASIQVSLTARRDQLDARGLINALLLTTETSGFDNQPPILHPVHIGLLMNASWEAWRRAEGGPSAKQPAMRVLLETDSLSIDLCPNNMLIVKNMLELLHELQNRSQNLRSESSDSEESLETESPWSTKKVEEKKSYMASMMGMSILDTSELGDHYYKDDLRSGAFKIVSGAQLPMAYQVTLHKNIISWRYPHPRAIIKLVAFPLPNQNNEVNCVLEFYSLLLNQWEPYIDIKLPVSEPREILLHSRPPEMKFSTIWRFRVIAKDAQKTTYQFNINKFLPTSEPTGLEYTETIDNTGTSEITAEQLSGILSVDSYFGPSQTPQANLTVRFGKLDLYVYNSLPKLNKIAPCLEGYYVSKPLKRAHRTLLVSAQDAMMHFGSDCPAGSILLFQTQLSTEIVDCTTGTMEPLTDSFRLQVALSIPENLIDLSRLRLCTTRIRTGLHLSRLRTIQALADDWQKAFQDYLTTPSPKKKVTISEEQTIAQVANALEGRVFLWIHNSCSVALRMGQEGTDEIFPLGPGTRLAYRWRYPDAKKRLRFAIAGPATDWQWSNCITFTMGESRIRLPETESDSNTPGAGVFLYITVKQIGAHRLMRLSGRVIIANMLKWNLLYKVRAQQEKDKTWSTISSGELNKESIGRSVISATNREMVLKIRFMKQETGWSGDIPLNECPKENVPWLVKVPSEGEVPYIAVWCRVVRARSDGRIFATIWPLYVLRSNLTLDTDVLLETEMGGIRLSTPEAAPGTNPASPPPLIQTAPGRGIRTHLLAPGTTSAKHSLSFQYRSVKCPVTREAVPLHYGVTDTSVFDKRTPINTIEEVLKDVVQWLNSSNQQPDPYWPHSIVSKHWKGTWQPTILQPRCDVAITYQAVRVGGGGCSLEVQLNPVLLLCNASPIQVTLRAHDAAPICKLDPGCIVSPPAIVLQKPFFISIEKARETFVSRQLEVCSTEPGRYGAPPPGHIAVDHPTTFAVPCHNKATILNVHYETKEEFNVIGLTPAFVFINKLEMEVSISTTAIPNVQDNTKPTRLRPVMFKLIQPHKRESVDYVPLCNFALHDRWRGGDASELALYLSVVLPVAVNLSPAHYACPVRLGVPPYRKPLALVDGDGKSVAVVVTQHKHEGRWMVVLSRDPCPQFLLHNRASIAVAIAQPHPRRDDAEDTTDVKLLPECSGVQWYCRLRPNEAKHYSGPTHTFSQPLPSQQPRPPVLLTLAPQPDGDSEPIWCGPVEITAGEQLVLLFLTTTVKLRVRWHPHTTLVELHDVELTDLSASDIRNRLLNSDRTRVEMPIAPTTSRESTSNKVVPIDEKKPFLMESEFSMRTLDMKLLDKDLTDFVEEQAAKVAMIKSKSERSQSDTSVMISTKSLPANDKIVKETSVLEEGISINEAPALPSNIKPESTVPERKPSLDITTPVKNANIGNNPPANTVPTSMASIKDEKMPIRRVTISTPESRVNVSLKHKSSETQIPLSQQNAIPQTVNTESTATQSQTELKSELLTATGNNQLKPEAISSFTIEGTTQDKCDVLFQEKNYEWDENVQVDQDRVQCMIASVVVEMAAAGDTNPLLAVHVDQTHLSVSTLNKRVKTTLSITDVQIDNLQYESGQFDFAVIATTRAELAEADNWPTVWNMFTDQGAFSKDHENSRVTIQTCHDTWTVMSYKHSKLAEIDFRAGPLALYVEDAYIAALANLLKIVMPPRKPDYDALIMAEARSLQRPLQLRLLQIKPIDVTLTLHTAVRMYIALDQSPLHLNAFTLHQMFTSTECLAHALTVHYLSAAILSAGWVVGGLELLGAPGALAARVGGATGGVRGIASTTAAALLRSLSACAGSLARNLDLLAGDEEHAKRAAAARRRPPDTFIEGLMAGVTNFAINILGAVGGLAHHPLVGVAVGETESSAAALRRSLVGALTKPLSATADLVAYAGHGLLRQTGWDPVPQPRTSSEQREASCLGWRRDCVRWAFRLAELSPLAGFEVLLDDIPLHLLITNKLLVVAEAECERIIEMIDLRFCTIRPYLGETIELRVIKNRLPRNSEAVRLPNEDDEFHISEAAMQRVARYTGAEGGAGGGAGGAVGAWGEARVLRLMPATGQAQALHAALLALVHSNADSHFALL